MEEKRTGHDIEEFAEIHPNRHASKFERNKLFHFLPFETNFRINKILHEN